MEQKDAVKKERGVERVKEIADVVLDNNGPKESLEDALRALITAKKRLVSGPPPVFTCQWV